MAEGFELEDFGQPRNEDVDQPEDDEATTSFIEPEDDETEFNEVVDSGTAELPSDLPTWATGEGVPKGWKQEEVASQADTERRVSEFDAARREAGYTNSRAPLEFRAKQDGTLYVKWGRSWVRLTRVHKPPVLLRRSTVAREVGVSGAQLLAALGYSEPTKPTRQQTVALTAAGSQVTDALQGIETIELQDLPQRASNVDIAIQTLVAEQETSFGDLPMREILGLNEALKRTRGALVDNLAKLSQLDAGITQAEQELGGEEAANDPEKNSVYKSGSINNAVSGTSAWRRPLRTVKLFAHSFPASRKQSSGYSMKTRRWQSAFVRCSVSRGLLSRQSSQHWGSSCQPLCWPFKTCSAGVGQRQHQHPPAMMEPLAG